MKTIELFYILFFFRYKSFILSFLTTHLNSDAKFSLEILDLYSDLMTFTVEKVIYITKVF